MRGEVTVEPQVSSIETDQDGWLNITFPVLADTIFLVAGSASIQLSTWNWKPPYRYVVQPDGTIQRQWPWLEFRSKVPDTSYQPVLNLLCKSVYPGQAFINSDPVKMYETGVFFKSITLNEGINKIQAEVIAADGTSAAYEREVFYLKKDQTRQAFPLWIDSASIEPSADQVLLVEDIVRISFKGSKGQQASVKIRNRKEKISCSRKDFNDYSLYQVDLFLADFKKGKDYGLSLLLESTDGTTKVKPLKIDLDAHIRVQNEADFPLISVNKPGSILSYNLGPIRLGGPIIAEYDPWVILKSNGQIGEYFRVRLNPVETAFIHQDNIEVLPRPTVKPSYYITYTRAFSNENADVVVIPYPEPVPYAIYPEVEQGRIRISLYGVKTSSTWMVHKEGLQQIENLKWEQTTPDTYDLLIYLNNPKIWGYELVKNGNSLEFRLKHPPVLEINDDGQIKGLVVSIEAGHGGHNLGAVGLSGLLEKEVNLATALELEKICRQYGIEVVQIRTQDEYLTLSEKRSMVEASKAHLHVSIHANSGGGGNYLGASGVSTYYHNPFWADFAKIMYRHLRELPLKDYGVIGSFNYTVTRVASRPAILVEQAFLSQAEDEEKLASPEFRRQMAEKIFEGILDYVRYMVEK